MTTTPPGQTPASERASRSGATPTFLLVGAARSGTTGLVEGIRQHPKVFVTEPKEPHYFALHSRGADFRGPGDANTINRVAVTDADTYFALYPAAGDHLARGDGSVSTLYYHEEAIPEILRVNPQMRLVVMLREPVARAYSSWQYMRARGFEPLDDFLAAVEAESQRKADNYHHLWHYTSMSYYAESVGALVAAVGPDQVGVWFHDDMERDYAGTVSEVLEFLGTPVEPGQDFTVERVNISGQPKSAALHRALAAATRHEAVRSSVKRLTSYRFRERVRRASLRRSGVPADAEQRLSPLFADDLVQLTAVLDGLPSRPRPTWLTSR